MISLVDEKRQWFKSKVGTEIEETARDISFCGHAIQQRKLFIVPDATRDKRFADNPLVTGDPNICFYAGAPLVTPEDAPLGALCVIDHVPRELTEAQKQTLGILARQVMTHLELRRHAQELARKEELLRIVTDNARIGLVIVNKDRRYVYANDAYAEILDLPSSSAIIDQRVAEVLPAIYEEQIRPRLDRAFAGERVSYELRKPVSAGTAHYLVSYEPTKTDGTVTMVVVVITDITAQKQAEAAPLRLASIVEFSDDAIIGKDLNSIITSWNRGAEKIFGYTAGDIVGTSIMCLIPADRQDEEEQILAKIRRGQSVEHFETLRQRKDGRLINVSVTASPIKDASGKAIGVSKIARDITEHERAKKALVESEVRFRQLAENITDVFWIASPDLEKMYYVSPAYEQIWGCSPAEIYANPHQWAESIVREDRERVLAAFGTLMADAPNVGVEYRIARPDGSVRWVHDRGFQVRDPSGRLVRLTGIVADITERKRAEEVLQKERDFISAVVATVGAVVVVLDRDARIVRFNRACERLTGYSFDEVKGRNLIELLIPPEDQARTSAEFANLCAGQFPNTFENCWLTREGNPRAIAWSNSALVSAEGAVEYVIGTGIDITQRKRDQEQIAEPAAFLDKARDAILVRDLDGKILFWNVGAERMYGWTRQEVAGRNIQGLLYADPKKFEEPNGLAIGQGEWGGELQHLTKDRRELTVEARWTLIRDNEGRPKSVLAINTDVTEKKKIEAQFMRAQRMESIGTLAGGVAHDLNNILAPIMMSIDILKTLSENQQATEILKTIEISARRGADIVRQVLSFARGLEGQRIEVQPKHLLKDLENIIKDTFPKDIRLHFSVPNDIWTILGDPTQVHQILLNLCVNARDAMPNGGNLTVSVENSLLDDQYAAMNIQAKAGRYVNINVTDSGTGMPPELIDKIFEPFFTTKDLNKGTGLGLSTVMAIVKSHEGIINVYSEPGRGTTFNVYLPAMETSEGAQKEQAEAANMPRGNGETILVIDDEASILTITSQTLQAFGYRVLTATDGADALSVYVQHKNEVAVVLTDMMMPVLDGPATIHALRRINPAVKIIAASGLNANGGVAQAAGAGIKHFLTKPYTASAMLKILRTILEEIPVKI